MCFSPSRNTLQKVYFTWSIGFFMFRALLSSFSMAEIHNRAKQLKSVIFCVPPSSYSLEVERFLLQVETDDIALTACGLMTVSRNTILTVGVFFCGLLNLSLKKKFRFKKNGHFKMAFILFYFLQWNLLGRFLNQ